MNHIIPIIFQSIIDYVYQKSDYKQKPWDINVLPRDDDDRTVAFSNIFSQGNGEIVSVLLIRGMRVVYRSYDNDAKLGEILIDHISCGG